MSLEAWGDEDPADSLCAVDGCGCKAMVGRDNCPEHRDFVQCDCGVWLDSDDIRDVYDGLGEAYMVCNECEGER